MASFLRKIPVLGSLIGAGDAAKSAEQYAREVDAAWLNSLMREPSKTSQVQVDPAFIAAQKRALAKMMEIGTADGLTAADNARLYEIMQQSNQAEKANREALMSQAAQRGMAGSGQSFAAQLANQQNAANAAKGAGVQASGMAADRALQALAQSGQLSSYGRSQSANEEFKKASAEDMINQFNAQQRGQGMLQSAEAARQARDTGIASDMAIGNLITNAALTAATGGVGGVAGALLGPGLGKLAGMGVDALSKKPAATQPKASFFDPSNGMRRN